MAPQQIVMPAFVSLLCICIVFVPMFFLDGVARFLFVPMAEAVMFAMICVVHPVAHAGADDGQIPAASRTPTPAGTGLTAPPPTAIRWCVSSAASSAVSSTSASLIAGC